MTLEEAIEIQKTFHDRAACNFDATSANAFSLGIEALKRISAGRNPERRYVCYLLPGETTE